jgi:hypothetical protein
MNTWLSVLILSVALALEATAADSREALLIVPNADERLVVVQTERGALRPVLELGMTASYGESNEQFAFVTNKATRTGGWTVDLLDKGTSKVVLSRPISGDVSMQLSGPAPNVILTSDSLYFTTVQISPVPIRTNRRLLGRNEQGGVFDFNRLTLASGAQKSWPLPEDCVNARLVNFEGVPLVYAWEGWGVWRFDSAKAQLQRLMTGDRSPEIRDGEQRMRRAGQMPPGAFADFVMVPGTGVMRLSKFGLLQLELGPDLRQASGDTPLMKVARPGGVVRILAGTYDGSPAIGIVRKLEGHMFFAYLDPRTTNPLWRTPLPANVSPDSIFPTLDNALIYVDTASGAINKLTRKGVSTLWQLDPSLPRLADARILSVTSD